ncbi:hypothetical protein [Streptomyces sp. NPDC051657]|uniref:hypothetical protein n=1 Tax=unclassified Streptomyces TaxID=2593676 RepID=UPI00342A0E63
MPISAGQTVTAGQLNRMQPKTYDAVGSGLQDGPLSNTDVTGCSVTFTTTTPNAIAIVNTTFYFVLTGSGTTSGSGRLAVDGVLEGEFAIFGQGPGSNADRATTAQSYKVTLPAAGSHTLKLTATAPTNVSLQGLYTTLIATVYEVV